MGRNKKCSKKLNKIPREPGELCRRVENGYSRVCGGKSPAQVSLVSLEWLSENYSSSGTSQHCSIDLLEVQLIQSSLKSDLLCPDSKVA